MPFSRTKNTNDLPEHGTFCRKLGWTGELEWFGTAHEPHLFFILMFASFDHLYETRALAPQSSYWREKDGNKN